MTNTTIATGYKQTEVGVIPEDWEMTKLGSISLAVSSGGTPSRDNPLYWDGDIPWITTSQINFGEITEAEQFITQQGLQFSSAKMIDKGALLIAMYGQGKTRGKVGVLQINATINQACAAVRLNDKVVHRFVYHYLVNQYEYIRTLSNSGGQENLSGFIVKMIPIVLPPTKEEQTAIASALSDMDALLDGLDRLITKKRNLKQAAMQQLLTGKTRLAGFEGEWEVKRLGDIAPMQRGFDLPNSDLKFGAYPVVYSNGILNHHVQYQANPPGVVTGRSGTIGKVSFIEEPYWPHNTALWVTSFKNNDPRFVFYLYTYIGFERFATGSGVPTLNRNDVHAFETAIPSSEKEQEAIAAVLADMDAEIAALEQRRTKTRDIKQGMMQELLTGRTRLVAVNSAETQPASTTG